MSISLSKGGNVSLAKIAPSTTRFLVGASWDARTTDGAAFDLDVMALMVKDDGKVRSEKDFIYYGIALAAGKPQGSPFESPDGSIHHNGDNLTGAGDGDDEQIIIDTAKIPADISKVVVLLTIFDAANRKQNFGQVRNARLRIADAAAPDTDLSHFDMTEDFSTETVVNAIEVYRNGADWKMRAVGQGYANGIVAALADYGVNAS